MRESPLGLVTGILASVRSALLVEAAWSPIPGWVDPKRRPFSSAAAGEMPIAEVTTAPITSTATETGIHLQGRDLSANILGSPYVQTLVALGVTPNPSEAMMFKGEHSLHETIRGDADGDTARRVADDISCNILDLDPSLLEDICDLRDLLAIRLQLDCESYPASIRWGTHTREVEHNTCQPASLAACRGASVHFVL